MAHITEWTETASADNADATATHAAESGRAHYVTCLVASYGGNKGGHFVLKSGGTTLLEVEVYEEFDVSFVSPIQGTEGKAITATLDASGTGGAVGYVTVTGYTV